MGKRHDNILETIGNTPVVRINHLGPAHVNLFAKVESFNPMGSVKDRLALGVIEDAERRGELQPGQTIVEATSGNTGIGLAMVCAQKGYPLVIVMAENFSVERRKLMRYLGAKVILTPASQKGSGMVAKAAELAERHGWWQPRQFRNPANAEVHARTTAVEILDDFADTSLDYWVTGFGTGGTLNGVAGVLRRERPDTRIVVCEPDNSPLLASGVRQPAEAAQSHPRFRPHLMQGWTPDFIPGLVEEVVDRAHIDEFLAINGNVALQCARDLARREGVFVGTSAGATLAGALQIAERAPAGTNILCMLPDTGERYLSTPLFADVSADMSEEEWSLSRSTPGYRFDAVSPAPAPADAIIVPQVDPGAVDEVRSAVNDPDHPVVMFSLEWCEFCWSVRKLLNQCGIPYRAIDLDSVEYAEGDRGGRIRRVLERENDCRTLPQIYVGGKFIGGCTELFDRFIDGSLQDMLEEREVAYDRNVKVEPYQLLPGWLHPR